MTSKPKTAVDGNAPGGPDFESDKGAKASGGNAKLGDQVKPETQTSEKDGHRTLVKPVTDPGPVLSEGDDYKHPNTAKGETLSSVNKPIDIMQRHDTSPSWATRNGENTMKTTMLPEVAGKHSIASDIYNKEKGEGLTDVAMRKTMEGREQAATSGEVIEGEADKAPLNDPPKDPGSE